MSIASDIRREVDRVLSAPTGMDLITTVFYGGPVEDRIETVERRDLIRVPYQGEPRRLRTCSDDVSLSIQTAIYLLRTFVVRVGMSDWIYSAYVHHSINPDQMDLDNFPLFSCHVDRRRIGPIEEIIEGEAAKKYTVARYRGWRKWLASGSS